MLRLEPERFQARNERMEIVPKLTYCARMRRIPVAMVAVAAVTGVLVAAAFGAATVYNGPATRAAAQADPHAHITTPTKAEVPLGKPTTRFAFRLTRNTGELAVYRTPTAAATAFAQAVLLAKAFGQNLKAFASVHGNAIIGFDKLPTAAQRAETQGWLRRL
jgi:hypothetical protein